ncbi:m protein [Cystoisospora suis]|uniref:M protein n=1 Tax=Cystoisospora suis TaxID=483139 RepID=A0A2C6KEW0_9APIC|nr:m protein [Cystoisospora suis]
MKARRKEAEAHLEKSSQEFRLKQQQMNGFLKRRETYKENTTLQRRETEKMHQDFLIDSLNERIRDLTEQKGLYESQTAAQLTETDAARAALQEAHREVEAIAADKQRVLQQWKSSVIGMKRREEALQAIKQMVRKQEERELEIEAEMRGVQATMREAQEHNENLTAQYNIDTRQAETIQTQIATVEANVEMAEKQNSAVQKSVQYALQEGSRAELTVSQLRNQVKLVETNIKKTSQENTSLTEQIVALLSTQATLNRAAASTSKRAQKLHGYCKRKEDEFGQIQNDTARTRVEALEAKARNSVLKEDLKQIQGALEEKERLIDQYEAEIKKGHIAIDKKQQTVEKLNKEYDDKRSKFDDESTGPLEAKIKSMRKQITAKSKEGADMQSRWMKKQTELIIIQNKTSAVEEEISARQDEQLILQQKKIRLFAEIALNQKELREMQGAIKDMRTEMSRVNQLIVKQLSKREAIERETRSLAEEFDSRMLEHEKLEREIDGSVQNIKEEKAKLEEELIEAERQIMLWERKIFLEKEMHEALDPAVGQSELTAMNKEIHRMQLRLEQLKKYQEQLLSEMQRVSHLRESKGKSYQKSRNSAGLFDMKRSLNLACILHYQNLVKRLNAVTKEDGETPLKASVIAGIKRVRNDASCLARLPCFRHNLETFRGLGGGYWWRLHATLASYHLRRGLKSSREASWWTGTRTHHGTTTGAHDTPAGMIAGGRQCCSDKGMKKKRCLVGRRRPRPCINERGAP